MYFLKSRFRTKKKRGAGGAKKKKKEVEKTKTSPKRKRKDTLSSRKSAEEKNIVTIEPHTQTTRCRPLRFSETVSYLDVIFVAFIFAMREKDDRSRRDVNPPPRTGDLRARARNEKKRGLRVFGAAK